MKSLLFLYFCVAMAGSDNEYGGYSPMRVISGGINLTF